MYTGLYSNILNGIYIMTIEKSKQLAKEWGIFVGFSAAANYLVAERLIKEGSARNVVTILCDRGERYFSCL